MTALIFLSCLIQTIQSLMSKRIVVAFRLRMHVILKVSLILNLKKYI